jgi:hypothetical protein
MVGEVLIEEGAECFPAAAPFKQFRMERALTDLLQQRPIEGLRHPLLRLFDDLLVLAGLGRAEGGVKTGARRGMMY